MKYRQWITERKGEERKEKYLERRRGKRERTEKGREVEREGNESKYKRRDSDIRDRRKRAPLRMRGPEDPR